jgi:hypothetical protein
MLIPGEWVEDTDRVIRPIIRGEVATLEGDWVSVALLVDTGADRTVLHANLLGLLGFELPATADALSGVGSQFDTVRIPTRIRFTRSDGVRVPINGPFSVSLNPEAPDTSILGRDVLSLFALVIDWPGRVVCLTSGRHRYVIQEN